MKQQDGEKIPVEGLSRRSNYEIACQNMTARLLATIGATAITELYRDLLPETKAAQAISFFARTIRLPLVDGSITDESMWKLMAGALTYERRIYLPAALLRIVTSHFNDNPELGHFGALNTAELLSADFCYPAMESQTRISVAGCELWNQTNARHHILYGVIITLPRPSCPWYGLTLDFVTDLPESMALGYIMILVIVDHLTKMVTYFPSRKDIYC
jgi:hypothetical protein